MAGNVSFDINSFVDIEFWQQPENTFYLLFLDHEAKYLNITNYTAPVVEPPVWDVPVKAVACVILICLSATFSGLTLGLMGLDPYGLEIIIQADPDGIDAQRAKKILPFRRDGNLMLCTLLLGNVAVNALLPIFLDELLGQLVSFFISTFALVILGEITPQAVCSRYALLIGSKLMWLMMIFTVLLYVIAKPIALVLDCALGAELGTIHNKNELAEIVNFHLEQGVMQEDEAKTIKGALLYSDVPVAKVMTKMEVVFSLTEDDELDFEKISAIFRTGYSRVPVLSRDDPDVVVGILLAKDLILVDPDDCMKVSEILAFFKRPIVKVTPADVLGDVMALFKTGRAHLGIVTNNTSDIVKQHNHSDSDSEESSSSESDSDSEAPNDEHDAEGSSPGSPNAKHASPEGSKKPKIKKDMSIAEKTVIAMKEKKRKKKKKLREKQRKEKERAEKGLSPKSSFGVQKSSQSEVDEQHVVVPVGEEATGDVSHVSAVSTNAAGSELELVTRQSVNSETAESLARMVEAQADEKTRVVGVISLEDIIEEILGDEIVDETDVFVEMEKDDRVIRSTRDINVVQRISILDHSDKDDLSPYEVEVFAQTLVDVLVNSLCARSDQPFHERRDELATRFRPAAVSVVNRSTLRKLTTGHYVTRRNVPCRSAYLVLDGLIDVFAGTGRFKSVAGRFNMVAKGVLEDCLLAQTRGIEVLRDNSRTTIGVGDVLELPTPVVLKRQRSNSYGNSRGATSSASKAKSKPRSSSGTNTSDGPGLTLARSGTATAAPARKRKEGQSKYVKDISNAKEETLVLARSGSAPVPAKKKTSNVVAAKARAQAEDEDGEYLDYIADFTAMVTTKTCRVLEIRRQDFAEAFRATMMSDGEPSSETGLTTIVEEETGGDEAKVGFGPTGTPLHPKQTVRGAEHKYGPTGTPIIDKAK